LGYPAGLNLPENDTEHLHFPGIGEQAARLLVSRQVPHTESWFQDRYPIQSPGFKTGTRYRVLVSRQVPDTDSWFQDRYPIQSPGFKTGTRYRLLVSRQVPDTDSWFQDRYSIQTPDIRGIN